MKTFSFTWVQLIEFINNWLSRFNGANKMPIFVYNEGNIMLRSLFCDPETFMFIHVNVESCSRKFLFESIRSVKKKIPVRAAVSPDECI